jgi:hypothetical protein
VTVYNQGQLEGLWDAAGGDATAAEVAAAIAQAESSGDSAAINNTAYPDQPGYTEPAEGEPPAFAVGLWQINILAHPEYTEAEMLDPDQNAAAAVAISDDGTDFSPWVTYTNGAYQQYLTGGGPLPTGSLGPSISGPSFSSRVKRRTTPSTVTGSTDTDFVPADVNYSFRGVANSLFYWMPAGLNNSVNTARSFRQLVR